MLINNKSLINTINKLNLTDDEREKFNKISEDNNGNFLYNGKPVTGGVTPEQAQQLLTAYEHSQSTHVQINDIPTKTSQLTNNSNYVTESYVETKIYEASLGGASLPECFITITGGV